HCCQTTAEAHASGPYLCWLAWRLRGSGRCSGGRRRHPQQLADEPKEKRLEQEAQDRASKQCRNENKNHRFRSLAKVPIISLTRNLYRLIPVSCNQSSSHFFFSLARYEPDTSIRKCSIETGLVEPTQWRQRFIRLIDQILRL